MVFDSEDDIMQHESQGKQVAQPAREEIKRHGEKLGRQVRDAAGKDGHDSSAQRQPATGNGEHDAPLIPTGN